MSIIIINESTEYCILAREIYKNLIRKTIRRNIISKRY